MHSRQRSIKLKNAAVSSLALNIIFIFMNNNKYLLLSGFYIFIIPSIVIGIAAVLQDNRIKINYGFLCSLILLILSIWGGINAGNDLSTGVLFSFILIFTEVLILYSLNINRYDINMLLNSIKYSAVIFAALMVISKVDYWGGGWRYSVKVGNGPIMDPNYLGTLFSSGFAISLYMIENNKDYTKLKRINILIGLICLICLFFTGSRGAMLAAVSVVIFFSVQLMYSEKKSLNKMFRNIICNILIIAGIIYVIKHLSPNIFKRLFVLSYLDLSNFRRIELWKNAFQEISKHFLFGVGCIEEIKSIGEPAHNTFLSIWLDLGVVGFITLLYMIFRTAKNLIKKKNYTLLGVFVQNLITSFIMGCSFLLNFWVIITLGCLMGIVDNPVEKYSEID